MRLRWNVLDCRWLSRLALAGLMCIAWTAPLSAQQAKKDEVKKDDKKAEPNDQQPIDKGRLETRYNKELRKVIEELTKGTTQAKDSPEAVDVLAQWHTFRVTWPEIQNTPGLISGTHGVMDDLDLFLKETAKNKAATEPLLAMFSTKVAEHMKIVLAGEKPIARLNGSRILARLAEVGREEVADALCDVLKDPKQNDGVKYYALKGIKDLLAQANQPNPTVFKSNAGKEREVRCLAAAGEFVNRKLDISPDLPRDEREALRKVNSEAVFALAANHRVAITDDKGTIVDSPALTLLRVARADGFVLEPRIDARVEAAIGVARMSAKSFEGYQPDYAAYHLAWFVVDLAQATNSGAKEPWTIYAARTADALEAMRAESGKLKEAKYVTELLTETLRRLKTIEKTGRGDPQPFAEWLAEKAPPNASLYKNIADSVIRGASADGPAKPVDQPNTEKEKPDKEKTDKEKK